MKTCSKCQSQKPDTEFSKSTANKDQLSYYCRSCISDNNHANRSKENFVRVSYAETHPDKWYNYYKKKYKAYLKDPEFVLKQNISSIISYHKRKGNITVPKKCSCCGAKEDKLKAFVDNVTVQDLLKNKKQFVCMEQLENIQWLCNNCLYKNRKVK
jgi:hypothetical protein